MQVSPLPHVHNSPHTLCGHASHMENLQEIYGMYAHKRGANKWIGCFNNVHCSNFLHFHVVFRKICQIIGWRTEKSWIRPSYLVLFYSITTLLCIPVTFTDLKFLSSTIQYITMVGTWSLCIFSLLMNHGFRESDESAPWCFQIW